MNYQLVNSYTNPRIDFNYTLSEIEIHKSIRTGDSYLNHIINGRKIGKKNPGYDYHKEQVPCYYPNVIFNKPYRKNNNIGGLTGQIYIDLDLETSDEPLWITKYNISLFPWVKSCWISFGGKGLGFTVRCDDLTEDNFNHVYDSIGNIIGYPVDNNSRKLTQCNVLGYDPDIYVNYNPTSFTPVPEISFSNSSIIPNNKPKGVLRVPIRKKNKLRDPQTTFLNGRVRIKFKMELEDYNDENYVFFIDGRDYMEIYIPKGGIRNGYRNTSLRNILLKLMYINYEVHFDDIVGVFRTICTERCEEPYPESGIQSLIKWGKEIWEKDKLKIKPRKKKYTWYNPLCPWDKRKKCSVASSNYGIVRRLNGRTKVTEAIQRLYDNGKKITQKTVANESGYCIDTIKKSYWKYFKDDVKILNSEIKKYLKDPEYILPFLELPVPEEE